MAAIEQLERRPKPTSGSAMLISQADIVKQAAALRKVVPNAHNKQPPPPRDGACWRLGMNLSGTCLLSPLPYACGV